MKQKIGKKELRKKKNQYVGSIKKSLKLMLDKIEELKGYQPTNNTLYWLYNDLEHILEDVEEI